VNIDSHSLLGNVSRGSTGGQPTGESRKRKFPDTNDKGEDGDGEKDMSSGRHDNDGNDDNGPLMACPYYKWRPLTHKNCQSKVLKEISKLKLHLWRCHDIPICFDQFPVERDRDAHLRNQSCHLRDRPSWDGITPEQKVKIKKRADPRRSRVGHWFVIFRVLFPGNPLPSSAFVEVLLCNGLATLRNFISQSWRPIYDSRAEGQLPDHLRQHVSAIQQFSHAVFEDTVALLLDQFQSASQSEASGSGRAGAAKSEAALLESSFPSSNTSIGLGEEDSCRLASNRTADCREDDGDDFPSYEEPGNLDDILFGAEISGFFEGENEVGFEAEF